MNRLPRLARCALLATAWLLAAAPAPAYDFAAISYHDIRYDVRGHVDNDQAALSAENLARQFQWLADHGFTPVSMQRILDAAGGGAPLPERAVLLTFDDGYRSFHEIVFPLLRTFDYPAVLALVTDWIEVPRGESVRYGTETLPREAFLTWEQIRELKASGLVEIASHSHAMHRGVLGNPQGNVQPAATTRIYGKNGYETQEEYERRVFTDIEMSARIIERRVGARPRVMVWPFGAFTRETTRLARAAGMEAAITLEPGGARLDQLDRIPRLYIASNPDIGSFARLMYRYFDEATVKRSVRLSLDDVHAGGDDGVNDRLGAVLDHVKELAVNTVVLKAFHQDGDELSVYFPNRHVPMRADLLNRVVWQLRTRAGVRWIYIWMPAAYPELGDDAAFELFEDLGRHLYLTGLFVEAPAAGALADPAASPQWLERLDNWRHATGSASVSLRMAVGLPVNRDDLETRVLTDHDAALDAVVDDYFLTLDAGAVRDLPAHETMVRFLSPLLPARSALADYVLEVPDLPGDGQESLSALRALLAAGAPSVGVIGPGNTIGRDIVERFVTSMSLRDHPYRP